MIESMAKDFLGKRISNELKRQNKTQLDLSQLTGLSSDTIRNVIHGRSNKQEYLKKIANALRIDLEHLTKEGYVERNMKFDVNRHSFLYNKLVSFLKNEYISVNKNYIDMLTELLYYADLQNPMSEKEVDLYLKGIIDYCLEVGSMVKEFDES